MQSSQRHGFVSFWVLLILVAIVAVVIALWLYNPVLYQLSYSSEPATTASAKPTRRADTKT